MEEIWKNVIGYENIYQVSNLFNVKKISGLKQGILKPQINKNGYFRIGLTKNNKRKQCLVHILVLESFVGPKPFPKAVCRHLDGNSSSKNILNLKWGTAKENTKDSIKHGTKYIPNTLKGSKHPMAKLNDWKLRVIRRLLEDGCLTHREIAEIFEVKRECITKINNGIRWKLLVEI